MSLSTGYRSIAKFILAFSLPVDYVLLDEPTLGLDAGHRQLFHQYLLETHMRRPRTIVLASHQIEEVAPLLEEIVLIDGGAVQLVASAEVIKGQVHRLTGPQDLLEEVAKGLIILSSQVLGKMKQVIVYGHLPQNLPNEIKISGLTLQDCFIQLTQREE
ncbi:hypothetical protein ACVR05_04345 [Streptococcus caprae]|uniref:ABC transporter ATP-binding protein n=1 Tax=Streptococcus caprae TaxID=1640501 RepID=A0ABV8CY67_9STRE